MRVPISMTIVHESDREAMFKENKVFPAPPRHRVMQRPVFFHKHIFVYRSNVTKFSIAYQPSFLRPP